MITRTDGSICANKEEAVDKRTLHLSRWKHVWPRQMTVDRVRKRDASAIMEDFYKEYRAKLAKWAKTLCRTWSLPMYMYEDLSQNALLQVHKNIAGWDPNKANLWTYSYLGIRKAMMCVVREYHHNKKYGTTPIHRFIESAEDLIAAESLSSSDTERTLDEIAFKSELEPLCMYSRIGIRRIVRHRISQHPKQMRRLLDVIVSDHTYAELARRSNKRISRQGYYNSIQHARKLIRADLEVMYA